MKKLIPWPLKIMLKIVLSRFPVPYRKWAGWGLFKHGQMASPDYALKIFFLHYDIARAKTQMDKPVFLEIGCGDSLSSAICAAAVGAEKIYHLDVDHFATHEMEFYCKIAEKLKNRGLNPPALTDSMTFEKMLDICNASYLTNGLDSLQTIPDNNIDFAWSHSVMEHVRKHEFLQTAKEHYRVLKPGGIISHSIDLQDHLDGNLNNLRFSEKLWESDFMAESGFYTNRLRASEILQYFEESGFIVEDISKGRWGHIPTPRHKLAAPYDKANDDDLLVRTLSCVLRKPSQ